MKLVVFLNKAGLYIDTRGAVAGWVQAVVVGVVAVVGAVRPLREVGRIP